MVNADLQENVAGLRVAQAFRREALNLARFTGLSGTTAGPGCGRSATSRSTSRSCSRCPPRPTALVLLVAAGQMRTGLLTAGALIAYLLYIDMLFSPVQQLSQVFDGYQQAAVGLRRISDLLRTPTSTPEAAQPRPVRRGAAPGSSSATCASATPGLSGPR